MPALCETVLVWHCGAAQLWWANLARLILAGGLADVASGRIPQHWRTGPLAVSVRDPTYSMQ
jgi:hypothetical protein